MKLPSILFLLASLPMALTAAPSGVQLKQSASIVPVFDFAEFTLQVGKPDAANPFTDVAVTAEVTLPGGAAAKADGFCDAVDGSVFRVRFMPTKAGKHTFAITYQQGAFEKTERGSFTAKAGQLTGPASWPAFAVKLPRSVF